MIDVIMPPSHTQIRQELQEYVLLDLLGPAGGEEEIIDEQYVRDRYILGFLAPRGQNALPDDDEDLPVAGQDTIDGFPEPASLRNTTMLPSSLGLTFTVDGGAKEFQITVRWGRYERIASDELGLELDKLRPVWKRFTWYTLGRVYEETSDFKSARECFEKAQERNPKYQKAEAALQRIADKN